MNSFLLIMFAMTFLSAFSQLLLKLSANETHTRLFGEYLNKKVITAYILFATVLFVDTYVWCGNRCIHLCFCYASFKTGAEGTVFKVENGRQCLYCCGNHDIYTSAVRLKGQMEL